MADIKYGGDHPAKIWVLCFGDEMRRLAQGILELLPIIALYGMVAIVLFSGGGARREDTKG